MKRSTALLLCLATGLFGACADRSLSDPETDAAQAQATAEPGTTVTPELLAQGREVWMLWCANCHGSEGRGDGPDATLLDPRPRDQTDRETMDRLSDREIAETVVYGGAPRGYPSMPSVPQVWGEDLVALVAYVRSLSQPEVMSVSMTADNPL